MAKKGFITTALITAAFCLAANLCSPQTSVADNGYMHTTTSSSPLSWRTGSGKKYPLSYSALKSEVDAYFSKTGGASNTPTIQATPFKNPNKEGEIIWYAQETDNPEKDFFVRRPSERGNTYTVTSTELGFPTVYTFKQKKDGQLEFIKGAAYQQGIDKKATLFNSYNREEYNEKSIYDVAEQLIGFLERKKDQKPTKNSIIQYVKSPKDGVTYGRFRQGDDNAVIAIKGNGEVTFIASNSDQPPIKIKKDIKFIKKLQDPKKKTKLLKKLKKDIFNSREWAHYLKTMYLRMQTKDEDRQLKRNELSIAHQNDMAKWEKKHGLELKNARFRIFEIMLSNIPASIIDTSNGQTPTITTHDMRKQAHKAKRPTKVPKNQIRIPSPKNN